MVGSVVFETVVEAIGSTTVVTIGVGIIVLDAEFIVTVAEPCAPAVEVEEGMKIIETGTLTVDVPERYGVTESDVLESGTVYAAPHGTRFSVLSGPAVRT